MDMEVVQFGKEEKEGDERPSMPSVASEVGFWSRKMEQIKSKSNNFETWTHALEFRNMITRSPLFLTFLYYAALLARLPLSSFPLFSSDEIGQETNEERIHQHKRRLAFLLNLHNAMLWHSTIMMGWPVKKRQALRESIHETVSYRLGGGDGTSSGYVFSLLEIEYALLRACNKLPDSVPYRFVAVPQPFPSSDPRSFFSLSLPEPRVSFALSSPVTSKSPPLQCYAPSLVHKQLGVSVGLHLWDTVSVNKAVGEDGTVRILSITLPSCLRDCNRDLDRDWGTSIDFFMDAQGYGFTKVMPSGAKEGGEHKKSSSSSEGWMSQSEREWMTGSVRLDASPIPRSNDHEDAVGNDGEDLTASLASPQSPSVLDLHQPSTVEPISITSPLEYIPLFPSFKPSAEPEAGGSDVLSSSDGKTVDANLTVSTSTFDSGEMEKERMEARAYLLEACHFLMRSVEVKDRRYRLYVYPRCFLGKDAVRALTSREGPCTKEGEAIYLCNRMIEEGFIQHVTREHRMEKRELFYQFTMYYQPDTPIATYAGFLLYHLSLLYEVVRTHSRESQRWKESGPSPLLLLNGKDPESLRILLEDVRRACETASPIIFDETDWVFTVPSGIFL